MTKNAMSPLSLPLIAALVVGAFASGCATTEGWNNVQTKNFNLYTNTQEHHKETLRQLENAYAALAASFFREKNVGKVDVLFLDDAEFVDYMGNFRRGGALSRVPGEGSIGKNGLLILRPHVLRSLDDGEGKGELGFQGTSGGGAMGNRAALAAKEMLTHIFIDRVMPKAPLWFHEGFAKYVSTAEIRSDGQRTLGCFGYPQKTEALMPISGIWDITFDQYAQPDKRGFFPAAGYTLIDFIMHAENNKYRPLIGPLVNGLASGESSAALVGNAFSNMDGGALDNLLGSHKQLIEQQIDSNAQVRGLCPFGVVVPESLVPSDTPVAITPVPPQEIAALLHALKALPAKDEYPPYYPAAVIDKVKVPPMK